MAQVVQAKTVRETVAENVRAFRQLRGIDQAVLARRMEGLGISWRQVTVSEVERGGRNVTVSELLGLAWVLGTTIEQLLDPRGPERIRGPWLSFTDAPVVTVSANGSIEGIPPEKVSSLVCTHGEHLVVEWDDNSGRVETYFWATNR
jgi:transcriptional regulator with XRE-family HTH domain